MSDQMENEDIKMSNPNKKSNNTGDYKVDSIVVSNLFYKIVKKKGKNPFKRVETTKTILDSINLDIKIGQLNAILGPSGSGKTTLLNFLAMRVQENSKPFGLYLVNGKDAYQSKNYKRTVAFIQQEEVLIPHITVKETLTYAARLRLPVEMSDKEKMMRVEELMIKLNLKHAENTIVGQPGVIKGVSGGERKRLSIGMELISNPSVLFVDEPTSGLDSVMSFEVIDLLMKLSKEEGVTVITTIHQPSSDIFKLFDNIILLKAGKILSYCSCLELIDLFDKHGLKMEKFTNPADHILTVLFDRENIYGEKFANIVENYHETQGKNVKNKIGNLDETLEIVTHKSLLKRKKNKNKETKSFTKPSFFYTFRVLCWRNFISLVRNPQGMIASIFTCALMATIIGLIFLRIGKRWQKSIQDRQGAILFVLVNLGYTGLQNTVVTFDVQRAVFLKEYLSGMYGAVPYFFSIIFTDLPVQMFTPLLFVSITYFLIGFAPLADNFFIFVVIVMIICLTMNGAGYMIGALAKDVKQGVDLVSIIILPLLLLSGFFINSDSIPKYLIWVQYISPFKYGYELMMNQEFKGLTFVCKDTELVSGVCPYTTGQQVLRNYFPSAIIQGLNWPLLIVLMVGFNLLALIALLWRSRNYKKTGKI